MRLKHILLIFGILLIIIQAVAVFGMCRMWVGLYPDRARLYYFSMGSSMDDTLNLGKALYAVKAGADRFRSSFEDISYSENEYRVPTAIQYASATIRESLGCSSGGSSGLKIYDAILTLSYYATGIMGVFMLIAVYVIHKMDERRLHEQYLERMRKAGESKQI